MESCSIFGAIKLVKPLVKITNFIRFVKFVYVSIEFIQLRYNISAENKSCIGRESNPGRPRGRRAFYHWTTDAHVLSVENWICNKIWWHTSPVDHKRLKVQSEIHSNSNLQMLPKKFMRFYIDLCKLFVFCRIGCVRGGVDNFVNATQLWSKAQLTELGSDKFSLYLQIVHRSYSLLYISI